MRMSEGVEWGLHCCIALAWLDGEADAVPVAKLAALFELPPAYLNKCLQALGRAGIVQSVPGARGGFRLAQAPERITFLHVVNALEGPSDAFRCAEIRQRGAGAGAGVKAFARPCGIAVAMREAEVAWRRELARQTVAGMLARTPRSTAERTRRFYRHLNG